MCVTTVYVDRYPNGTEAAFHQHEYCQYGYPGHPCQKHSLLEKPVRKIDFSTPTTEYIMNHPPTNLRPRLYQHPGQLGTRPATPPRSRERDHRHSGEYRERTSFEYVRTSPPRRQTSQRLPTLRPTRQHRKERIILVDAPPTPRTPPQIFAQTFPPSAPSSPANRQPAYFPPEGRGRPIIVDERPLRRTNSLGAVVGERRRVRSPPRSKAVHWESPSNSHTSFDTRARLAAEEAERARREAEDLARERERARIASLQADRRYEARIREQNEAINRRPPVPLRRSGTVVIDQGLNDSFAGMVIRDDRLVRDEREEAEIRRRMSIRAREDQVRRDTQEQEAMNRRLRERQGLRRRLSVGPGTRRSRVHYDDGMFRYE